MAQFGTSQIYGLVLRKLLRPCSGLIIRFTQKYNKTKY